MNLQVQFCGFHKIMKGGFIMALVFLIYLPNLSSQHSVARQWSEVLLESIRNDFARPTVHARNLFHCSMAMYDAWAAYDSVATNFFLGNELRGFGCEFEGVPVPDNIKEAQEEAMSYAMYRILRARFINSPRQPYIYSQINNIFNGLGYDPSIESQDYTTGSPAALGNYIGQCILDFGLQDGSNEQGTYANLHYETVNSPLIMDFPGNPDIDDPNRWQPLTLEVFIDQAGNVIPGSTPAHLSPEWGEVVSFALKEEDLTIYERDGYNYWVYHDPGPPPLLDSLDGEGLSDEYKWTFSLVSTWSSHLDPSDGVMWDISPGSIGNIDPEDYPETLEEYTQFYDLLNGGDASRGHDVNPSTGEPYEPQIVPRGDYARVLAEFWADGPQSETPPGHWFTIINYVHDHPLFERKFEGEGEELDDLEWDVKAYLLLGGTMHDVAITAWGIKGYYDYVRPVSALRYMADHGQSSDPDLPNYSLKGIPLIDDYIEMINEGDPLAGVNDKNVGKIKIKAWKGPDYIQDPDTDVAEVDWILAEEWWPYQRPTFVTPPFAGYISGHSTYSAAAARALTLLTGDPFFPGGMGEFDCPQNEFLVFEDGPSTGLTLQWATYRDASDQCSLSRIWGGIHPPADDIPGRFIGPRIATDAFELAKSLFNPTTTPTHDVVLNQKEVLVFPNPVNLSSRISLKVEDGLKITDVELFDLNGRKVFGEHNDLGIRDLDLHAAPIHPGLYVLMLNGPNWRANHKLTIVE